MTIIKDHGVTGKTHHRREIYTNFIKYIVNKHFICLFLQFI